MTDENNMFQIEIVENETVYACSICYQGFEICEGMKKTHSRDACQIDLIDGIRVFTCN